MTWVAYISLMLSGIIHGAREYTHKDLKIFEKIFGVSPTSFWGSQSWKRKYKNNDPEQGMKNRFLATFPAVDFWHVGRYVSKSLFAAGTLLFTLTDPILSLNLASPLGAFISAIIVDTFWGGLTFWLIERTVKQKESVQNT